MNDAVNLLAAILKRLDAEYREELQLARDAEGMSALIHGGAAGALARVARAITTSLVAERKAQDAKQELADQAQELDMGYGSDSGNTKPAA